MATVLGIGGVFVKSRDPDALRAWYRDMLGLEIHDWGGAQLQSTERSYSVWSAFRADTDRARIAVRHPVPGEGSSISANTRSTIPSSRSSLLATCL